MKKWYPVLLSLGLISNMCHAFDGAFTEAAKKTKPTKIKVTPVDKNDPLLLLISWSDLGMDPEGGAMFFKGDKGAYRTQYFAIGGNGPFALIEEEGMISLIVENPEKPRYMRFEQKEKPTLESIKAEYQAAQGLGAMSSDNAATEANVEKAVKTFNSSCGASAKKDISWGGFKSQTGLANLGAGAILGMADLCKDADVKKALAKIAKFTITFNSAANDLAFAKSGSGIEIKVQEKGYNPRERAMSWVQKEL